MQPEVLSNSLWLPLVIYHVLILSLFCDRMNETVLSI